MAMALPWERHSPLPCLRPTPWGRTGEQSPEGPHPPPGAECLHSAFRPMIPKDYQTHPWNGPSPPPTSLRRK